MNLDEDQHTASFYPQQSGRYILQHLDKKTYKHTGDTNEQKGEWKILDFLISFAQEFKVKYKK